MTKKLPISFIFLVLSVLTLASLAFQAASPFLQVDTLTTTPEPSLEAEKKPSLEAQAGKSDGITVWGILIFLIITIPMVIHRKEL
jgi:hypothetical protein